MNRLFFLLLFLTPAVSNGQFSFSVDQSIPVKDEEGNLVDGAWAGGLNAAQYNTFDLDHNGHDDLVLFDRTANKVITFINIDNDYVYHPEYETFFPPGLENLMLLRDFNCDGKKDIFTYDLLGLKVFENITEEGKTPKWKHYQFYAAANAPKSDVILTKGFSGLINLKIQFDDLPAITDADGDGDLDIFTVRFAGAGSIEYHKNFSVERYGTCDSLEFERITQSWGNFFECHCGEFALNGSACEGDGRTKHAGGKSLLAFDANGDANIDIIFSESECTQLYLFTNEGTADAPVVNSFSIFPSPEPVDFSIFPGAFYEDVNFDGNNDLVATPNIYETESEGVNLKASNWLYSNTGTAGSPTFEFQQTDFLQDKMIDVGFNAVPAFADLDGDTDLDLFISASHSVGGSSSITVYENTGTAREPEFEFLTDHYLDFATFGFHNVKIHFCDIDGTGTADLLFTATDESGFTRLYYVPNASSDVLDFENQNYLQAGLFLTYFENISVADVNADKLPDLLVGRSNGKLEYWENTGGEGLVSFSLSNQDFISTPQTIIRQNITASEGDLNADGKPDLVVGDQTGILKIISNYRNSKDETGSLIFNSVANAHYDQNLGGPVWPLVVDLYQSGKPSIFVGNSLGGIQVLKNEHGFALFPNPILKDGVLTIKPDEDLMLEIYSNTGSRIQGPIVLESGKESHRTFSLSAGFYIFRFTGKNKSFSRKIIIE
jgi:hypothetical protein